jgi:uncharacterized membrane protein
MYGILTAILWGVADYYARFSTRRIGTFRTLCYMEAVGVTALTIWLAASGQLIGMFALALPRMWAWVVFSALLSTVASLAFYRALEIGTLVIVSPLTSVYPVVTLLLSVYAGERLSRHNVIGIVIALIGAALAGTSFRTLSGGATGGTGAESGAAASGEADGDTLETLHSGEHGHIHMPPHGHLTRGAGLALFASVGYGLNFWVLAYRIMPALNGVQAVWAVRGLSLLMLIALGLGVPAKMSLQFPRGSVWRLVAAVGLLDAGAFVVSNFGMLTGHVSVTTVLGSLFSAVTVFLAWIFLRERIERTQWAGIFLIFIGIVLVSA